MKLSISTLLLLIPIFTKAQTKFYHIAVRDSTYIEFDAYGEFPKKDSIKVFHKNAFMVKPGVFITPYGECKKSVYGAFKYDYNKDDLYDIEMPVNVH